MEVNIDMGERGGGFPHHGSQESAHMWTSVPLRMTQFNKSKTSGFTLIELLVVIAIIALLSAIVTSALASARTKARDGARVATGRSLKTALAMYEADKSSYRVADTNGNPAGPNCDGTGPANKTASCSFGTSKSIAQVLGEQGYLNSKSVKDVTYGDDQYYVGVCDAAGQTASYDVFMKLEKNGVSSSQLSSFCGAGVASAYGYDSAVGASGGGVAASTVPLQSFSAIGVIPSIGVYGIITTCVPFAGTGKIYCLGGDVGSGQGPNMVMAFDPNTSIVSTSSLGFPIPVFAGGMAVSNGKIYYFGGYNSLGGYWPWWRAEITSYNPNTGAVAPAGHLPGDGYYGGRTSMSCVTRPSTGIIYCIGGSGLAPTSNTGYSYPEVMRYDPIGQTISTSTITNATSAIVSISCVWSTVANKIYCFGGSSGSAVSTVFSIDPNSMSATTESVSLATPSVSLGCIETTNGKIDCMAVGASTQEFDVSQPTVTTIMRNDAAMPGGLSKTACAQLGGLGYCFGGQAGTFSTSTVFRFLP